MAEGELKDLGWVIVELMGQKRTAGQCREERIAGVTLLRLDVPHGDGMVTQWIGGGAIYRITPTTEAIARAVAARSVDHEPIYRWQLPTEPALPTRPDDEDEDKREGSDGPTTSSDWDDQG